MYNIAMDSYELSIVKSLVKNEYQKLIEKENNRYLTDFELDMIKDSKLKLLLLIGKLDNTIPVANKITEDTSILAARKYGLFKRK